MRERGGSSALPLLALCLQTGCAFFGVTDELRAYRAHAGVGPAMSVLEVFDVLAQQTSSSPWTALLAGYGCTVEGKKRTWVLSTGGRSFRVITHLQDTPFGGQGDWKELTFADGPALRTFLGDEGFAMCETYQASFGNWGFGMAVQDGRVQEVLPVEYYQPAD